MRHKSEERMQDILDFVNEYYLHNRHSPSMSEIANAVGVVKSTAYKYLVDMNKRGMLSYDGTAILTEQIEKYKPDSNKAAILGSVSCGIPMLAEENTEDIIVLPTVIFGDGDFYIVRANGESMIEAGIDDGDLVVIRKQKEAKEGDIVVALVDNENTLKRVFFDRENRQVRLHPENKNMEDIIVPECSIQGVAVRVIKNLD